MNILVRIQLPDKKTFQVARKLIGMSLEQVSKATDISIPTIRSISHLLMM